MSTSQRRQEILGELAVGNRDVGALAARFGVSESTIRRDLNRLAQDGLVQRTYGGALPARPGEPTVAQKRQRNVQAKQAIARRAAAQVRSGDSVVLDAGTTTGLVAWELRALDRLTVLTNGVSVLDALRDHAAVELMLTGGTLRPVSQSLLGPLAEQALSLLTPDHVFVGADGVDPHRGINCPSLAHSSWKRGLLDAGRVPTIVADASKIGAAPHDWWAPVAPGVRLLTDHGCSPAQQEQLAEAGYVVERVVASGNP